MKISVTSLLGREHYDDLEQLFFFNPRQGLWRRDIIESVEKYGNPRLVERDGQLRIELPLAPEAQTLYAMVETDSGRRLAGAMVFSRAGTGEFLIIHLAAKEEYTSNDQAISAAAVLVKQLCSIARQVKGADAVALPYGRGKVILSRQLGRSRHSQDIN